MDSYKRPQINTREKRVRVLNSCSMGHFPRSSFWTPEPGCKFLEGFS